MGLEQLIAEQQQLVSAARAAGRDLNAEEQARFNELQRQIDEIRAQQREAAAPAAPAAAQAAGEPAPDPEAERSAGATAERQRIREITTLCRDFNIDPQAYIDGGQDLAAVRAAVLEQLRQNSAPVGARTGDSGEDRKRAAVSDALLMRSGIRIEHPAEGAADFAGASLRNIAASCLSEADNTKNWFLMDASRLFEEVCQRQYLTPVASFPAILDQTIQKAYVDGHKTAPVTFDRFTSRGVLTDFKKATNRYQAGAFGEFLEVPEGGELKHFVPQDEKLPQRQLKTYGRQFTMSRQAFIDDDIGMITRLPRQAAAAARRTQNKQVYKILVDNKKIYDGANLFCSAHKNLLGQGTGMTREAVYTMIMALGGHKTKDGDAILIRPATIVVPLGYKFDMYTLFNSQTIDAAGTVNPLYQYRDQIEVVEDATLNALVTSGAIPWFMFGDRADCETIAVDYLNGQDIPNVRRMEVAGQLGFIWDFYLDWGISVQDYRGVVKNPGIEVSMPIPLA